MTTFGAVIGFGYFVAIFKDIMIHSVTTYVKL